MNGAKDHTLPHIDPSSSSGKKLVSIVHDRLKLILGADYNDVSLAQYVVVMLSHKTNRVAVQNALVEFLDADNAARFTHWLYTNVGFFVGRPSLRHDGAASSPSRHARERTRSQDRHRHRSRSPTRRTSQGGSDWQQNDPTYSRGYDNVKPWERPAVMDLEVERIAREVALAPPPPPPPAESPDLKIEFEEDEEEEQEEGPSGAFREQAIGPITIPGKAYVDNNIIDEELEAIQPLYDVNDLTSLTQIQITVPGKAVAEHRNAVYGRKVVVNGVVVESQGPEDLSEIDIAEAAAGIPASPAARSVLVKGIPLSASTTSIKSHFKHCGYIVRFSMLRDRATTNRSELAWIEFNTFHAQQKALELDGSFFKGSHQLRVLPKESPEARAEVERLNKGNYPAGGWVAPVAVSPVMPVPVAMPAPWGGGGRGYGRGRGRGRGGSGAPRSYKWQRQPQNGGDSNMKDAGS